MPEEEGEGVSPLAHFQEVFSVVVFEGFPFIVGWELTLACNLRCRHCGSSAGTSREAELTFEEALKICDQFPELLVHEVNFTGGEPLVRTDWPELAGYIVDLGINVKILTNGLALSPDAVAEMKKVGISAVGVSLDGLGGTHDSIRGYEGLFETAWAGMERVLEASLPVTVITTVNALNVKELPSIFARLTSLGVSNWQVQPLFFLGRAPDAADLYLTEESYRELGTFVTEWSPLARQAGMEILPGDSFGYFTELDNRDPPWRGCGAGLLSCGITSDGKVKGCLSLPDDFVEGDLREKDLWGIWFGDEAFAYTRDFRNDKLGPNCRSCDMGDQCRGGCSAMSYGYTGRFHNDAYCFYSMAKGARDPGPPVGRI